MKQALKLLNPSEEHPAELEKNSPDRQLEVWTTFCHALLASAEFQYLN